MRDLLQHIDEIASVAAVRPCGLFVDIDGTLAPIQPRPDMAVVPLDVRDTLEAVARRMSVAVLTGRSAAEGKRMVGSGDLLYVGNHGMEWLEGGREWVAPEAASYAGAIRTLAADIAGRFSGYEGLIVEDKGVTLSVHYRLATDPSAARSAILEVLTAGGRTEGLRVSEGKRVVEVRPPIEMSKGTSLARIVQERGLAAAIAMGDDVTDVDMLLSVRALTASGALRAGIGITVSGDETPPALLKAADYAVNGPEGATRFLRLLAELP